MSISQDDSTRNERKIADIIYVLSSLLMNE